MCVLMMFLLLLLLIPSCIKNRNVTYILCCFYLFCTIQQSSTRKEGKNFVTIFSSLSLSRFSRTQYLFHRSLARLLAISLFSLVFSYIFFNLLAGGQCNATLIHIKFRRENNVHSIFYFILMYLIFF